MEAVLNELMFSMASPFISLRKSIRAGLLHVHDHFIPHARNNYHPHILGHRALALSSLLLVTVKITTIVLLTAGPALPAYSSAITIDNVFSLTNQSRVDNGLQNLSLNSALSKAAQKKAEALLACNCFQHNLPDGRVPWDFIKAEGYSYIAAGENLAVDFTQAENVESAWMNSPGHRANILNKTFEEIGIGISQGEFQGHNSIFVVQMFGTPMAQPIKTLSQPTIVAEAKASEPAVIPAATETKPATNSALPKVASPSPVTQKVAAAAEPVNPNVASELPTTVSTEAVEQTQNTQNSSTLNLVTGKAELVGSNIKISVSAEGNVSKVVANFQGQAAILDPKGNGVWEGAVDASKLTENNKTLTVTAYDMDGKTVSKVLGSFTSGVVSNYNLVAKQENNRTSFLGMNFDAKQVEYRFYLIFTASLLTCLAIAIAIKRHIQHVSLIANTSFVAIFAMLLLLV